MTFSLTSTSCSRKLSNINQWNAAHTRYKNQSLSLSQPSLSVSPIYSIRNYASVCVCDMFFYVQMPSKVPCGIPQVRGFYCGDTLRCCCQYTGTQRRQPFCDEVPQMPRQLCIRRGLICYLYFVYGVLYIYLNRLCVLLLETSRNRTAGRLRTAEWWKNVAEEWECTVSRDVSSSFCRPQSSSRPVAKGLQFHRCKAV